MSAWLPERIGPLIALWNEGKSGAEIASYLGDGLTRNAVIGKLHRLGLTAVRSGDRALWNGHRAARQAPSPPRSFSWEQRA